jgi:hypothetical protein
MDQKKIRAAVDVAKEFNRTIFSNTPEMVGAVEVLVDLAEEMKNEDISNESLQDLCCEIHDAMEKGCLGQACVLVSAYIDKHYVRMLSEGLLNQH